MANATILVVEDEPDIREVTEYNLAREGYRVITAADGETAVRLARSEAPDLVLLDLMLPIVDGIEVCKRLRELRLLFTLASNSGPLN